MTRVHVTGHRNPDLDSVGSAIGYAELMQRLHPGDEYLPARLGEVNAQTAWALERSGAPSPALLGHIMLRVRDVMQERVVTADADAPVRDVGLAMAEHGLDLIPIVDRDGALVGVVTERNLARAYIRESRGASAFGDRPVSVQAMKSVLGGEILAGDDREFSGRLWVISMDVGGMGRLIEKGDLVVIGDRPDAQRRALELGVSVLVTSNGVAPRDDVLAQARERDVSVLVTPLDSYVAGRMIGLAVPCRTLMRRDPLTVTPDDLLRDIAEQVMDVDYRAAIALDAERVPVAIVNRSDLVNPEPRRVLLVDHAEQAQSVPGVEEADIVEILDHHHVGSIETRIPVKATFDPVGSTATLVVERFRQEGREPKRPTAVMLLAAVLSDTVILTSPTTTDRDRQVIRYLEESLELEAEAFGREMFEETSDVSRLSAEEIIGRDTKEYDLAAGRTMAIGQVETVGTALAERSAELLEALEGGRAKKEYALFALMITDITSSATKLLIAGDASLPARAFGIDAADGVIELPGVMSRKKQVAPKLLSAA